MPQCAAALPGKTCETTTPPLQLLKTDAPMAFVNNARWIPSGARIAAEGVASSTSCLVEESKLMALLLSVAPILACFTIVRFLSSKRDAAMACLSSSYSSSSSIGSFTLSEALSGVALDANSGNASGIESGTNLAAEFDDDDDP